MNLGRPSILSEAWQIQLLKVVGLSVIVLSGVAGFVLLSIRHMTLDVAASSGPWFELGGFGLVPGLLILVAWRAWKMNLYGLFDGAVAVLLWLGILITSLHYLEQPFSGILGLGLASGIWGLVRSGRYAVQRYEPENPVPVGLPANQLWWLAVVLLAVGAHYWRLATRDFIPPGYIDAFEGALLAITVFTFNAVIEEYFYRGLLQARLSESFGFALALLLQSGLFAAAHTTTVLAGSEFHGETLFTLPGEFGGLWMVFGFGLLMGLLTRLSRSIWPAVAVHLVVDFYIVAYWLTFPSPWDRTVGMSQAPSCSSSSS